jgi:hypothetical protein
MPLFWSQIHPTKLIEPIELEGRSCDEIAGLVDCRPDPNGGIWLATFALCKSRLTQGPNIYKQTKP